MFDNLRNRDVLTALEELIACLGVREEAPADRLFSLVKEGDAQRCAQEIASRLGLPVRIILSYMPSGYESTDESLFHSALRMLTGWGTRRSQGIVAQVDLPQNLPMFGAHDLEGYPIQVRVSDNCIGHPKTFVTVMAHELSHVLLALLYHPRKDSELHTDLVPIVLGFGSIIRKGRKRVEISSNNVTKTTTYGYLSDLQFVLAYERVRRILRDNVARHARLVRLADRTHRKVGLCRRRLARFHEYLEHLDATQTRRMRQKDATKIVQFHASDYTRTWEAEIMRFEGIAKASEESTQPTYHYTESVVRRIRDHRGSLELACQELDILAESIAKDLRILRRYIPVLYRLRNSSTLQWIVGRFRSTK